MAIEFVAASSQYLSVGSVPCGVNHTSMFWAKSKSSPWNNFGVLGGTLNSVANGYDWFPNGGTLMVLHILDSSSTYYTVIFNYDVGTITNWQHYAWTLNSSSGLCSLYVNGALGTTGNQVMTRTLTTNTMYQGRFPNNAWRLNGYMADWRDYTRELSAEEIKTIFESRGHDTICTDLSNRETMVGGTDGAVVTALADVSPNSLTVTPTASPTWEATPTKTISRRR